MKEFVVEVNSGLGPWNPGGGRLIDRLGSAGERKKRRSVVEV